jgi:hypothetical protein
MKAKTKKGRKPVSDKKIQVSLYVKKSTIKNLKGIDNVQEVAYVAIETKENEIVGPATNY